MRESAKLDMSDLLTEFDGDSLGDERLGQRLHRIVSLAAGEPADSFSEQVVSVADREALYRFLANPKVTMAGVLSGHLRQTAARLWKHPLIRIVHDTTTFHLVGDREGLGAIRGGAKGCLAHLVLAVSADEIREPLGVLGVHPYIHQDAVVHQGMTPSQRVEATRAKPRAAKESARWEQMALQVAAMLPTGVRALHVMDQEADDYDVRAAVQDAQSRHGGDTRRARSEPRVCNCGGALLRWRVASTAIRTCRPCRCGPCTCSNPSRPPERRRSSGYSSPPRRSRLPMRPRR